MKAYCHINSSITYLFNLLSTASAHAHLLIIDFSSSFCQALHSDHNQEYIILSIKLLSASSNHHHINLLCCLSTSSIIMLVCMHHHIIACLMFTNFFMSVCCRCIVYAPQEICCVNTVIIIMVFFTLSLIITWQSWACQVIKEVFNTDQLQSHTVTSPNLLQTSQLSLL